jgi:hypothetical protein
MKKRGLKVFLILIIFPLFLSFVSAAWYDNFWPFSKNKITGKVLNDNLKNNISVIREIHLNENSIIAIIKINSSKHIISIKEFLPTNSIIDYNITGNYEILEFKSSETTWIIADKDKIINTHITYILNTSYQLPEKIKGNFSYFKGEKIIDKKIIGEENIGKCASLVCLPSEIKAGENFTLTFHPSEKGIYKYAWIYRKNKLYKAHLKISDQWKVKQKKRIQYSLPTTWINDIYTLKVYDYSGQNNHWKEFDFVLIGGKEIKELQINLSKKNLNAGQTLNINIDPGSEGISKYAHIYINGNFYEHISLNCSSDIWKCKSPISFNYDIPNNSVTGDYSLIIYDLNEINWQDKRKEFNFHVNGQKKQDTKIQYHPKKLNIQENLDINITPGSYGISRYVYVYKDNLYIDYFKLDCPFRICKNPINKNYKIPYYLVSGNYSFRILDYSEDSNNWKDKYKYFYFEIQDGAVSKNLSVSINPSIISAGQTLNLEIKPSNYGISRYISYGKYKTNSQESNYYDYNYYKYKKLKCESWRCHQNINTSILIHSDFPQGDYWLRIYDYSEKSYLDRTKKFNFTIEK